MSQLLDQLFDRDKQLYYCPYLPLALLGPLQIGSLSPNQGPDFDRLMRSRTREPKTPKEILANRLPSPDFVVSVPRRAPKNFLYNNLLRGQSGHPETVAIIDTGIHKQHPLLQGLIDRNYDCVLETGTDDDNLGEDLNGHGTTVALLLTLTSPSVRLLNMKVADKDGQFDQEAVAHAINASVKLGANRISLSLGCFNACWGPRRCEICRAAEEAIGKGVLIFAAAGNSWGRTACPAKARGVYSIANYELRSLLSETSTLPAEARTTLHGKFSGKSDIGLYAIEQAEHSIDEYDRLVDGLTGQQSGKTRAFEYLTWAVNLSKEAFLVYPEYLDLAVTVVEAATNKAFAHPFVHGLGFLDYLWYYVPEKLLSKLKGQISGAWLSGTSFAAPTATSIPTGFARVMSFLGGGDYAIADGAVARRTRFSGRGEYVGGDGKFILAPFEYGVLVRALRLHEHRKYPKLPVRLRGQTTRTPMSRADQLCWAILRGLNGGNWDAARESLESILRRSGEWKFVEYLLTDFIPHQSAK